MVRIRLLALIGVTAATFATTVAGFAAGIAITVQPSTITIPQTSRNTFSMTANCPGMAVVSTTYQVSTTTIDGIYVEGTDATCSNAKVNVTLTNSTSGVSKVYTCTFFEGYCYATSNSSWTIGSGGDGAVSSVAVVVSP
ncbi:MAG TPA: hypothetical protein VK139_02270 [Microbacteriaceae bacterium]|nr:hypothetical protein [Microbacteriaceae bacterium]